MKVIKATPTHVTVDLDGVRLGFHRPLIVAAIQSREHREITVHGDVGMLTHGELLSCVAAMDDAADARREKRIERAVEFDS